MSYTLQYTLDQMERPTTLTETGPGTVWVRNATYGPGGEMHSMQYRTSSGSYYTENRSYNNDSQLASLQTSGSGLTGVNLTYTYPTSPANAGRIWKTNNVTSGEQIVYAYDALNRLSQASAAGWGQSFAYDGFGNLIGKTATAGSAPYMSLTVDPTTNRTATSGFQYDANGNLTNLPNVTGALSYDIENRTGSTNSLYSNLAYDMENQPLDRGGQWNLYGLNGERLGTYTYTFGRDVTYINGVDYDTTPVYPAQASRNIYFGGRLIQSNNTTIVVDAQGSVRASESGQTFEFYPYGEEMGSGTTGGREKFATYTRESNGLDYANQGYYSSTYGAFTSADPLHQTATTPADPNNPGSWNRFAYTAADPINRFDPSGTSNCLVAGLDDSDDDDDDTDVSLGHCGNGLLPSGSTVCHALPGVIFTFNGVPSTCELWRYGISIIVADDQHVAQPTCSISLDERPVPLSGSPGFHTYLDVTTPGGPVQGTLIEGGPIGRGGFLLGSLYGYDTAPSSQGLSAGTSHASDPTLANNTQIGATYSGPAACNAIGFLDSEVDSYDVSKLATYNFLALPGTYNSNSFTYTLLQGLADSPYYYQRLSAFGSQIPGNLLNTPGWGKLVPGL